MNAEDDKESTHNDGDGDDAILSEIVAAATDQMTSNIYIKSAAASADSWMILLKLHPVPILLSNTGYLGVVTVLLYLCSCFDNFLITLSWELMLN